MLTKLELSKHTLVVEAASKCLLSNEMYREITKKHLAKNMLCSIAFKFSLRITISFLFSLQNDVVLFVYVASLYLILYILYSILHVFVSHSLCSLYPHSMFFVPFLCTPFCILFIKDLDTNIIFKRNIGVKIFSKSNCSVIKMF